VQRSVNNVHCSGLNILYAEYYHKTRTSCQGQAGKKEKVEKASDLFLKGGPAKMRFSRPEFSDYHRPVKFKEFPGP
jgi:hypothetical protein